MFVPSADKSIWWKDNNHGLGGHASRNYAAEHDPFENNPKEGGGCQNKYTAREEEQEQELEDFLEEGTGNVVINNGDNLSSSQKAPVIKSVTFDTNIGSTFTGDNQNHYDLAGNTQLSQRNRVEIKLHGPARRNRGSTTAILNASTRTIGNMKVNDHFSIPNQSSQHNYMGNETLVFPLIPKGSIVLEKVTTGTTEKNHTITVKYFNDSTPGFYVLRAFYALVAILVASFVFMFSVQVMLFLWIGLAINSGFTSNQEWTAGRITLFLGALCSIRTFLFGMAKIMETAQLFVMDSWDGQRFLKNMSSGKFSVAIDWLSTTVYIFVPILTIGIGMLRNSETWWDETLFAWFIGAFCYFSLYLALFVSYEIRSCLELIHANPNDTTGSVKDLHNNGDQSAFSLPHVRYSIYFVLQSALSGVENVSYLSVNDNPSPQAEYYEESKRQPNFVSSVGMYARLTLLLSRYDIGLFKKLANPRRLFTVEETLEQSAVTNKATWSLDNFYCRNRNTAHLGVVAGRASVTFTQTTSSLVCFILGFALKIFILVAIASWLNLPMMLTVAISALYLISILSTVRNSVGFHKTARSLTEQFQKDKQEGVTEEESMFLYEQFCRYRITKPSLLLIRMAGAKLAIVNFLFPTICFFSSQNIPVGFIFIFLSIFTFVSEFFNVAHCFMIFGSMDGLDEGNEDRNLEWRKKHRYGKMGARQHNFWKNVFTGFMTLFALIFTAATILDKPPGNKESWKYTSEFVYPVALGNLKYPTCAIGGVFTAPSDPKTSLLDFAWLAGLAYESKEAMTESLSIWFNNETALDHADIVEAFRTSYEAEFGRSDIEYKFIGLPDQDVGILSIRGTVSLMEALVDIQLWCGSAVSKFLRFFLPCREFLSPIFKQLIKVLTFVESGTLKKISFYQQTSAFVEYMKTEGKYSNIVVVGHSLGGGLAMITGSQKQVPAIAISAPNALLSSVSFDPPITPDNLREFTFNVVPDRDIVPLMDDLSQNYQRIRCRLSGNSLAGCHMSQQSVCEILYTCGSNGRPIPCHCSNKLGYEDPVPIDSSSGLSFADACPL